MCSKHETILASDEIRTKIAMSRTKDDLIVLSSLDTVLHHIAKDIHITLTLSLRTTEALPATATPTCNTSTDTRIYFIQTSIYRK